MSGYIFKGYIYTVYITEEEKTGESPMSQSSAAPKETGAISSLWLRPAIHNWSTEMTPLPTPCYGIVSD